MPLLPGSASTDFHVLITEVLKYLLNTEYNTLATITVRLPIILH